MSDEPEIREVISDEKSKRPLAVRDARQLHAKRLRQARKLLKATEEEAREAIMDAGLTGQEAVEALRIWRANRS